MKLPRLQTGSNIQDAHKILNQWAAELERLGNMRGVGCVVKRDAGGVSIIATPSARDRANAASAHYSGPWAVRVSGYNDESDTYTVFCKFTDCDIVEMVDAYYIESVDQWYPRNEGQWIPGGSVNQLVSEPQKVSLYSAGTANAPIGWTWCETDGSTPPAPDSSYRWCYKAMPSADVANQTSAGRSLLYFRPPSIPNFYKAGTAGMEITGAKSAWTLAHDVQAVTGFPIAFFRWDGADRFGGLSVEQLQYGPLFIPGLPYTG